MLKILLFTEQEGTLHIGKAGKETEAQGKLIMPKVVMFYQLKLGW